MFCDESITIICMIVFSFINCKPAAIDEIQSPTHEKFHIFLFFIHFFTILSTECLFWVLKCIFRATLGKCTFANFLSHFYTYRTCSMLIEVQFLINFNGETSLKFLNIDFCLVASNSIQMLILHNAIWDND